MTRSLLTWWVPVAGTRSMGNVATAAYGVAFLGGVLAWILLLAGTGMHTGHLSLMCRRPLHDWISSSIHNSQGLGRF